METKLPPIEANDDNDNTIKVPDNKSGLEQHGLGQYHGPRALPPVPKGAQQHRETEAKKSEVRMIGLEPHCTDIRYRKTRVSSKTGVKEKSDVVVPVGPTVQRRSSLRGTVKHNSHEDSPWTNHTSIE